jgi:hypothetical protein
VLLGGIERAPFKKEYEKEFQFNRHGCVETFQAGSYPIYRLIPNLNGFT